MSDDFGRVSCGTCGKTIKFPPSKAGTVAKCPNCSEPLRLGVASDVLSPAQPETTVQSQPAAITGDDLEAMATVLLAEQLPFVRVQLGHLRGQLLDGETVYVLAKGHYKNQQTLVAATNYRVIFIRTAKVVGKAIEDLPISKIGAIQSKTGILGGEVQIFSSGHNVTLSMVMPKQRADDLASFISGQINGLPLPERPTYAMPAKKSAAVGCLAVIVLIVALSSIASLFDGDDTLPGSGDVGSAEIAPGELQEPRAAKSPTNLPEPSAAATPPEVLRQFARDCDALLAEIDEAWKSQRFAPDVETDSGAAWGMFIRSINSRVSSMREASAEFSPAEAKIHVGAVAGYLQSLARVITSRDQSEYPKLRQYVDELIADRDAYLMTLADSQ